MEELVEYRRRYGEAVQQLKDDILVTKRLATKCQEELNRRLASAASTSKQET